jgi:hypothetical protein
MDNHGTAIYTLQWWAYAVATAFDNDIPLQSYESCKELFDALRARDLIDEEDDGGLLTDFWQNPLVYKYRQKGKVIEVKIISKGRNGIYEEGAGDDVALTVTRKGKTVEIIIREPSPRGVKEWSMDPPASTRGTK